VVTSTAAPESLTTWAISSGRYSTFTGTATAPVRRIAKKLMASSGHGAMKLPTRSPGRTPSDTRAWASRSTASATDR
jgi:hypothetical protein